uniref:protein-tyrosine-phosphatase n=1 Tax=Coccidioides posadasii RMSCC 3488 TaxID=454284 RepID=A0A0J6F2W9_COCPO|nr:tyrosine phosphatase [Coccidioides posadasii RMSCC 3488]
MANPNKRPLSPTIAQSLPYSPKQPPRKQRSRKPPILEHSNNNHTPGRRTGTPQVNHISASAPPTATLPESHQPFAVSVITSLMSGFTAKSTFRDGPWRDSTLGTRTITGIAPVAVGPNRTQNTSLMTMSTVPPAMSRSFGRFDGLAPPSLSSSSSLSSPSSRQIEDHPPIAPPLLSRESMSTASESTDSSPTTTSSTFDSPIIVETSPDSSPESPSSIMPLPSLKSSHQDQGSVNQSFLRPMSPNANPGPTESSNRRAKNLKNLSLRLPASPFRPPLSTAPIAESGRHLSEPSSPVRPHSRGSKRRPPNLTIQTPGFQRPYSSNGTRVVPPTPSVRPTLRHIESSPSLNSILSPTHTNPMMPAPFPSKPFSLGTWCDADLGKASNQTNFNPNEPLIEFGEEDDCPISRESRKGSERGYPDGPIRIYDSGLWLYLEPNQEEASKFDVVFNVAKEVNNPFSTDGPKHDTVMSVWKATLAQSNAALRGEDPDTASNRPEPEYIHVPWDHNSEILDDLFPLCEIIDNRISKGKRVLIHCQLGVSRSASLVIAYGLYKNTHLDFNAVYGMVKERSCWVGPNMSLIYQLTDFRTKIRGGTITRSPADYNEAMSTAQSPHIQTTDIERETAHSKAAASTPNNGKPVVDPSKLFTQVNPFSPDTSSNRVRRHITPRPLPLREKFHTIHSLRNSPCHDGPTATTTTTTTTTFQRPSVRSALQMDLVMQDVPPSPSFFSPKASEFIAAPFPRSKAGDITFEKFANLQSPNLVRRPSMNDPRSPQRRAEPIIMRSIDEFL